MFVLTTWYSTKLPWASCYYYKKAKQKPQIKSKQTNKSQLQLWWILENSERLSREACEERDSLRLPSEHLPGSQGTASRMATECTLWPEDPTLFWLAHLTGISCVLSLFPLSLFFPFHTIIRGSLWVVRMHWYEIWSGTLESGRDFHL